MTLNRNTLQSEVIVTGEGKGQPEENHKPERKDIKQKETRKMYSDKGNEHAR